MTTARESIQHFFQAIIDRRIEAIVERYAESPETYVFIEGPRWSTRGYTRIATGWQGFVTAPLQVVSVTWVEGPFGQGTPHLAWVAGVVQLVVQADQQQRTVRFRASFVLQPDTTDQWRIIHEHVSQPAHDPYGIGDWLLHEHRGEVWNPPPT